ncbi:MAG: NAD(P)H-hydrate dehydratase [Patescibacteria group bacterium]|nr:NAD(P)H-hydrate dehydratase [Patescibacteria group bacterium]
MNTFNPEELKKLYIPRSDSHKGQNGKLAIIGGSHLFHGASLWALKVASRIVDMVFYSSVLENNEIAQKLKSELYDLIVVPREKIEDYLEEADTILIGPGLPREEGLSTGEESTRSLVERLLKKFPNKKWIIDGGALTEIEPEWLKLLNGNVILTPHHGEFERLFGNVILSEAKNLDPSVSGKAGFHQDDNVVKMARGYNCIILLKGEVDIICSPQECVTITGGNAGMTKGGTGDVLAGLVAALACKNDLFLSAKSGSFINKKAGEELFEKVGLYFNASDLADEIPKAMKKYLF